MQDRKAAPETGIEALMRYAKTAKELSARKHQPEYLPEPTGGGTDSRGYARYELLSLDQLEPENADFFGSLGATHVVRLTPPEL